MCVSTQSDKGLGRPLTELLATVYRNNSWGGIRVGGGGGSGDSVKHPLTQKFIFMGKFG